MFHVAALSTSVLFPMASLYLQRRCLVGVGFVEHQQERDALQVLEGQKVQKGDVGLAKLKHVRRVGHVQHTSRVRGLLRRKGAISPPTSRT
ncbi:hypothetical protein MRX96_052168 [Rhipicephalus microplus]